MAASTSHIAKAFVDPAGQQVAAVYARALLGAAENAGQSEAVLQELHSFITDVLDVFGDFEKVLTSRLVSSDDKVALLERTLGGRASTLLLNFLKVLAGHDRLVYLRGIYGTARRLYDELLGRRRVEVFTATPLGEDLAGQIKQQLHDMLGGEPKLVRVVDPDLIGGVVLRVGDTVFDGSVATRLARVRGQMINRSVHEIQRRRDRFSHPARN
ncbi:MAG: ATP synthase F1 subunit delta [Pirellulales bacterium]